MKVAKRSAVDTALRPRREEPPLNITPLTNRLAGAKSLIRHGKDAKMLDCLFFIVPPFRFDVTADLLKPDY